MPRWGLRMRVAQIDKVKEERLGIDNTRRSIFGKTYRYDCWRNLRLTEYENGLYYMDEEMLRVDSVIDMVKIGICSPGSKDLTGKLLLGTRVTSVSRPVTSLDLGAAMV